MYETCERRRLVVTLQLLITLSMSENNRIRDRCDCGSSNHHDNVKYCFHSTQLEYRSLLCLSQFAVVSLRLSQLEHSK